jgi:hypothetical protein
MIYFLRPRVPLVALALIVCISLSPAAGAQSRFRPHRNASSGDIPGSSLSPGQAAAIVIGVAAAITVVVVLVIHSKKSNGSSASSASITGCVASLPSGGKTLTDESSKQVYLLAGSASGATPGERMTLSGKPGAATTDFPFVWNIKKVQQDYGACHP